MTAVSPHHPYADDVEACIRGRNQKIRATALVRLSQKVQKIYYQKGRRDGATDLYRHLFPPAACGMKRERTFSQLRYMTLIWLAVRAQAKKPQP